MMIKIYDKNANAVCVHDGNKWIGNLGVLPKALELIVIGMQKAKGQKAIEKLIPPIDKPSGKTVE